MDDETPEGPAVVNIGEGPSLSRVVLTSPVVGVRTVEKQEPVDPPVTPST